MSVFLSKMDSGGEECAGGLYVRGGHGIGVGGGSGGERFDAGFEHFADTSGVAEFAGIGLVEGVHESSGQGMSGGLKDDVVILSETGEDFQAFEAGVFFKRDGTFEAGGETLVDAEELLDVFRIA